MTSSRPYLVRALYEWINDDYKTAHIMVNAEFEGVIVPKEYVNQGKIVLNISPDAIHKLKISNQEIEFDAMFSGASRHLYIPMPAVMAIYAKENNAGMVFGSEPGSDGESGGDSDSGSGKKEPKKPKLSIVK